jgi:hypothetical protein
MHNRPLSRVVAVQEGSLMARPVPQTRGASRRAGDPDRGHLAHLGPVPGRRVLRGPADVRNQDRRRRNAADRGDESPGGRGGSGGGRPRAFGTVAVCQISASPRITPTMSSGRGSPATSAVSGVPLRTSPQPAGSWAVARHAAGRRRVPGQGAGSASSLTRATTRRSLEMLVGLVPGPRHRATWIVTMARSLGRQSTSVPAENGASRR